MSIRMFRGGIDRNRPDYSTSPKGIDIKGSRTWVVVDDACNVLGLFSDKADAAACVELEVAKLQP